MLVEDCPVYNLGAEVEIFAHFSDPNAETPGAPIDPSEVFFTINPPDDTPTEYQYGEDEEITLVSEGVYKISVDANASGEWFWRAHSTGVGKAADEGNFKVRESKVIEE